MIPAQPSHTAHRVAVRRAAHQILDHPPVLEDPLAIPILGAETAAALRSDPSRFESGPLSPYLRAFMAVRARFAEDQLAALRARGVGQYVILGAGLDTFAYRDPSPGLPLRVWEVDYPATQAWKREQLGGAGIAIPAHVTFAAIDFERDALPDVLAAAGFDAAPGALFAWLGVTPYLTHAAIRATLAYVAGATRAGGGVVFDYAIAPELLSPARRAVHAALAERVEAAGEPFRSSFEPQALADELRSLGFAVAEDVSPDELNARYLSDRTDGLRVGGLTHLMWAGAAPYAR
jgi:methyltransferase (TIGR00027 family)